jgi:hypothetical protein
VGEALPKRNEAQSEMVGLFAFKSICVNSAYILLSVIAEYLKCTETVDMPRTTYAQSNSAVGTLT